MWMEYGPSWPCFSRSTPFLLHFWTEICIALYNEMKRKVSFDNNNQSFWKKKDICYLVQTRPEIRMNLSASPIIRQIPSKSLKCHEPHWIAMSWVGNPKLPHQILPNCLPAITSKLYGWLWSATFCCCCCLWSLRHTVCTLLIAQSHETTIY